MIGVSFVLFYLKFKKFIYSRHWVFIAVHGFSPVVASEGSSLVVVCGFLTAVAFLVAEHGLSICGVQA